MQNENNIEIVDSTTITNVDGAAVLDKLAALDFQRRAEREKRREEAQQLQDPRENVQARRFIDVLLDMNACSHWGLCIYPYLCIFLLIPCRPSCQISRTACQGQSRHSPV